MLKWFDLHELSNYFVIVIGVFYVFSIPKEWCVSLCRYPNILKDNSECQVRFWDVLEGFLGRL